MSDIPEDVMKVAETAAAEYIRADRNLPNLIKPIARAILAERERCANLAGIHGGKAILRLGQALDERSTKAYRERLQCEVETAEEIAAAIRGK